MSQALKLVVKSVVPPHHYDALNGVLELESYGNFTVTIEACANRIAALDRQIAEKTATNEREHQKYLDLRAAKEQGGWTAAEVEQERANAAIRVRTRDRLSAERQALEREKTTVLADYNTVSWCWRVVGNGVNAAQISHNASFTKGTTEAGNEILFPRLLEGGGLCWLEAFREETDPATGTVPNGLYVRATGTPAVLRCEWTDYEFNPITGGVGFGSEVLLHIYTGGLFGQEISVGLVDRDLFSFNDSLPIANATAFTREVNVYEEKPFEAGKTDVEGALTSVDAAATSGSRTKNFVQKTIVEVLIDPAWEAFAGSSLKIYPVVKHIRDNTEFEGFERAYLEVNNFSPKTEDPNVVYTNNPVLIGQIETRVEAFSPCRYNTIVLTDDAGKPEQTVQTLYDAASTAETRALVYETIAPATEAQAKQMVIQYGGLSVVECKLQNKHVTTAQVKVGAAPVQNRQLNGEQLNLPVWADANFDRLVASPESYFFTTDAVRAYNIKLPTCAQPNTEIQLNVYPNIEREVALIVTLFPNRSFSGTLNYRSARVDLRDHNQRSRLQLIRQELDITTESSAGLGYGLQAKVKIDNRESSVQLAAARAYISKIVEYHATLTRITADFDGRGREGDSVAMRIGIYNQCTFEVEAPNLALALRITNKKVEGHNKVVNHFVMALALKPIIAIKIVVDLITLVKYLGVAGRIADWVKEVLEEAFDIDIYLLMEIGIVVSGEINFSYNTIEGFGGGDLKLEAEMPIGIKGGVKSRRMITVAVTQPGGGVRNTQVEEFKAEAGTSASIIYSYEVASDRTGKYTQHKVECTGVKATFVLYSIRDKMTYNVSTQREFTLVEKPEKPWYDSDKIREL